MTLEELNEVYYINLEIKSLQLELEELRQHNFYKANIITDMPRGGHGVEQPTSYVDKILEIEDMLKYSLKRLQIERKKILDYINKIQDKELREIIRFRCINNLSWYQIGDLLEKDRRTVSRKFFNFFKKCTECDT